MALINFNKRPVKVYTCNRSRFSAMLVLSTRQVALSFHFIRRVSCQKLFPLLHLQPHLPYLPAQSRNQNHSLLKLWQSLFHKKCNLLDFDLLGFVGANSCALIQNKTTWQGDLAC